MATLSDDVADPSLPQAGVISERLGSAKKAAIGQALGKSDSWAQKVLDGECGVLIHDMPILLRALELKAVDRKKVCVDRDVYLSLKTIAGAALEAPRKLEWE